MPGTANVGVGDFFGGFGDFGDFFGVFGVFKVCFLVISLFFFGVFKVCFFGFSWGISDCRKTLKPCS